MVSQSPRARDHSPRGPDALPRARAERGPVAPGRQTRRPAYRRCALLCRASML